MAICVGCGLDVNNITGLLEVQLSGGDPGSGLHCDNTTGLSIDIQHTNGNGVALTGLGTTVTPLHAEIIRSPDTCNGIDVRGNGLWAPSLCTVSDATLRGYFGAIFPVGLNTGGAGLFSVASDGGSVSVHNPLNCEIKGIWDVQCYGGRVVAHNTFDGYAYLSTSINGGPFGISTPATYFRMDNRSASGDTTYNINNLMERNYIVIPALATYTFDAKVSIQANAGTGDWYDTQTSLGGTFFEPPRFEFHWQFTPTGIC